MKLLRALLPLALAITASVSVAADVKVLTAGAFKPVLLALQPEFERQSGHRLLIDNDTAGALQRRITAGEVFDVVFSSPVSLRPLQQAGKVAAEAPRPLARVAIGVAVRQGDAKPDLTSVETFRQMLLNARSVAYIDPAAGGSSGIYLDQLYDKLGVGAQVRAKAVLVPGGLVAQRVVNGSADIAIHQISEILAVPQAVLVGPLPAEIQNYTVYAGAAATGTQQGAAVKALFDALESAGVDEILRAKGMERAR